MSTTSDNRTGFRIDAWDLLAPEPARYTGPVSEADRRARARARQVRGVTVERIESLDTPVAFHEDESVDERLTAMTQLCRAAWLATGRPLPPSGRAQRASLPGEVYIPDHVAS
ncbi:MAG: hypothetical protein KF819_12945 [Labilithrix sp.]|nr:hypothetical protein [Labilithrix sp.]